REGYNTLAVKLPPENINASIAAIRETWQSTFPGLHFEYSFLDDEVEKSFGEGRSQAKMFFILSFLAITIACMGIFGLVSFTAEQKTKEIGIRKVMGATVTGIVRLLSKEFIILIVIANAIAWPLGYMFISQLLQEFPFRVNVGVETFLMTGFIAVLFTLLTAGYQALRAALANPVDSLRCE
ncbi:MAG: FtsX-like permease family protein, partial [candidate division Zixibacteria bacterium]|nr:FtsX-like permease family protein [candidate division Zixibacteria bacterium]